MQGVATQQQYLQHFSTAITLVVKHVDTRMATPLGVGTFKCSNSKVGKIQGKQKVRKSNINKDNESFSLRKSIVINSNRIKTVQEILTACVISITNNDKSNNNHVWRDFKCDNQSA